MAMIEIKMHATGSMCRKIKEGQSVEEAVRAAQADYPDKEISVIGDQSFGYGEYCVGGPERDFMPGY